MGNDLPKIEIVSACTVRVPLKVPTSFSTRRVLAREYALVRVRGTDGVTGIGFCYGGNNAGGLVTKAVAELLAPLLMGEDCHAVEAHWERMYAEALLHGRTGSVMRAIHLDTRSGTSTARSRAAVLDRRSAPPDRPCAGLC